MSTGSDSPGDTGSTGQESANQTVMYSLQPVLLWVSLGVTVAGTALAVLVLVFGWTSLLNVESLKPTLERLARAFPAVGVIVVMTAVALLLRSEFTSPDAFGGAESTEDDELVVDKYARMDDHLEAATAAQYRCESDSSIQSIHGHLLAGAIRAVMVEGGLDRQRAREIVQSGDWTDDPVAAGFLAADSQYPPRQWLYGVVDPGGAYRHRVRRTIDAIDTIDGAAIAAEATGVTATDESAPEHIAATQSPEVEQ